MNCIYHQTFLTRALFSVEISLAFTNSERVIFSDFIYLFCLNWNFNALFDVDHRAPSLHSQREETNQRWALQIEAKINS